SCSLPPWGERGERTKRSSEDRCLMTHPEPTPDPNPLCGGDPLARALARLRPAPTPLDANRLLFEAGQVARDRDVALWRRLSLAQFVLLFAVGCVAAVYFAHLGATDGQSPRVQDRIVYVKLPSPDADFPEVAPVPRSVPDYA